MRPRQTGRQCVLVVGHLAGDQLFGAERSLLDLLDGFAAVDIDTVVAVPATENQSYLDELAARCCVVETFDTGATWPRRPATDEQVATMVELIQRHRVDAVHINTIVPLCALHAARRCGIPGVVHARELPVGDPDLCMFLGVAEPQQLVDDILAGADYVVACSRAVAAAFPLRNATCVVPNVIDVARFPDRPAAAPDRLRVALVGSTTQRKGLLEFIAIAELLSHRSDVEFVVVGPLSDLVLQLQASDNLPDNLSFAGYVAGPELAMAHADVLVSLSMCHEAFGRTVLEAMGAGVPVVAYGHGGIPDVVDHGVTGFLTEPGDRVAVAARVAELADNRELHATMGTAGRQRAVAVFSPAALARELAVAYRAVLPSAAAREQSVNDLVVALPTHNRSPHLEPYFAGSRARFAQCTSVRFIDSNHVVVASLLGRELFLVRLDFDQRIGEIVASVPTTDGRQEVSVDLLDFDGDDRIVASNCEFSSVSTYLVGRDILRFDGSRPAASESLPYCHGAAFMPQRPGAVCVALTTDVPRVAFLVDDGPPIEPFIDAGWIPKSVAFVGQLMVVVSVLQNNARQPTPHTASQVTLVALGAAGSPHRILDSHRFEGSSFDGCHARGDAVYIADQECDVVRAFDVIDERLVRLPDLLGFSLPHDVGVSLDGSWIAVAIYGDNELRIRATGRRLTPPDAAPTSPAGSSVRRRGGLRWSPRRLVRGRGSPPPALPDR